MKNITKYLEFNIGYDSIPGYNIENIDSSSGRVILSDEGRSASLLNMYMYNMVNDTYDLINFVVYDDYSGTNTFSYVVDRNFITFEKYFNRTSTDEFELKVIFTVDEDIEDYFVASTTFDISSIQANIYYDTPNTEHTTNLI